MRLLSPRLFRPRLRALGRAPLRLPVAAPLTAIAARLGVPVALLGSTQQTLELTATRLMMSYPNLSIVAQIAGGGIGGGVLIAIIGLVRQMMGGQGAS